MGGENTSMKVLIVNGSRADAGPLVAVWNALTEAGHNPYTFDLERAMGNISRDDRWGVSCVAAMAVTKTANKLSYEHFDLVLLLGDRYEALGAAVGAYLMGKPIAHLSGGDVTEGSQDDSMRHAITKLAHLHFVTCNDSACRLLQMGEEPWRVHNVGCPGVDTLLKTPLLSIEDTLKEAGLPLGHRSFDGVYDDFTLVAFHPNSFGNTSTKAELTELLEGLNSLYHHNVNIALTSPNKDVGHTLVEEAFTKFAAEHAGVVYLRDPGRPLFLSLLKHCTAFLGNSSSGFYEAPYFGTQVVNVGDRQNGRFASPNIKSVPADKERIYHAVQTAYTLSRMTRQKYAPYGRGDTGKMIALALSQLKITPSLLQKKFHNIKLNKNESLTSVLPNGPMRSAWDSSTSLAQGPLNDLQQSMG